MWGCHTNPGHKIRRLKHCSNQRKVLFFFFAVASSFHRVLRSQGVASPFLSCSMAAWGSKKETEWKLWKLPSVAALRDARCTGSMEIVGYGRSSHIRSTHSLWWAEGSFLLSPSSSALSCQNERFQSCRACQTFYLWQMKIKKKKNIWAEERMHRSDLPCLPLNDWRFAPFLFFVLYCSHFSVALFNIESTQTDVKGVATVCPHMHVCECCLPPPHRHPSLILPSMWM